MILRNYQETAVVSVLEKWRTGSSSLLGVAGTGAGKTQIFCEVIKRSAPLRALILAHRDELVTQAYNRLAEFGMDAEIEKGEQRAATTLWNRSPVVIATPQTLYGNKNKRLKRFRPEDFEILIIDEGHHYSGAPAYEGVVKHFQQNPNLKTLAVTATPDRHDNIALSRIVKEVAFDIEIQDLIHEGWLVDIDQRLIKIESLDFSGCRKTAGDLNGRDLADLLEEERTLLGMTDASWQVIGQKRTLVFCASVKQAERMSEIFNRYKPGVSACVFGHTPEDERKDVFQKFGGGSLQILVNVGVCTEGYDNPGIECLVMARSTLSRALYAQMLGRGTRPLQGVVSEDLPSAELRKEAIKQSRKASVLVLDFVGNSGRHKLIFSGDIFLGGKVSVEAQALAKKRVEEKGGRMLDELEKAEQEIREKVEKQRREGITARAAFTAHYVNPFDDFQQRKVKWDNHQQLRLSEKQRHRLLKTGWNPDDHTLKDNLLKHKELIAASIPQKNYLLGMGAPPEIVENMVKWDACKMIDACIKNGRKWPKKNEPEPEGKLVSSPF